MSLNTVLLGILLIAILVLVIVVLLLKDKIAGYKDLEKNYSTINVLQEIMGILGMSIPTDEKLAKINDELLEHFGILYSTIIIKKGDKLIVRKSNIDEEYYEAILQLAENELFKENIEKNVSKYITTSESGVLKYPTAPERNIKSALLLPVYRKSDYIGFWLLEDIHEDEFDKIEKVQLSIIKDNLALILENVGYDEELEQKTNELEQKTKELESANAKLEQIVNIDGLTGVFNKRFMNKVLDFALDKQESEMTIIMADIDHFKNYNDKNGHLEGDNLLKNLADIIKSVLREEDMIFRFGGEEFVIFLSQTNKVQGKIMAEKIRSTVEQYKFAYQENQPEGNLTISVGVAFYPDDGIDRARLLQVADERLYKAKNNGRNKVYFE